MKNKYEYPPGLFGFGFIAAGSTAKPPYVQPRTLNLHPMKPVKLELKRRPSP